MSEPFIERLSRFTPDAGGLDRDALLFAAGRASARPNRRWMGLSAVLATTQVLALVALWPSSNGVVPRSGPFIVQPSPSQPATEREAFAPLAKSDIWSIRHAPDDTQLDAQLAGVVVSVETEPILRAFGPLPSSVVN
jgi:hypothetical protein